MQKKNNINKHILNNVLINISDKTENEEKSKLFQTSYRRYSDNFKDNKKENNAYNFKKLFIKIYSDSY